MFEGAGYVCRGVDEEEGDYVVVAFLSGMCVPKRCRRGDLEKVTFNQVEPLR